MKSIADHKNEKLEGTGSITDREMLLWGGTGSITDRRVAGMPGDLSVTDQEVVYFGGTNSLADRMHDYWEDYTDDPLTVTLRPNGTVLNGTEGGGEAPLTGGATLHAVLLDDSDASYVTALSGSTEGIPANASEFRLDLGTFSFGSATIDSVTVRVRASSPSSTPAVAVKLVDGASDGPIQNHALTAVITTYTGTTRTTKPSGGAWTQAAIDGLRVNIEPTLVFDGGQQFLIYALYVDVVYTP